MTPERGVPSQLQHTFKELLSMPVKSSRRPVQGLFTLTQINHSISHGDTLDTRPWSISLCYQSEWRNLIVIPFRQRT